MQRIISSTTFSLGCPALKKPSDDPEGPSFFPCGFRCLSSHRQKKNTRELPNQPGIPRRHHGGDPRPRGRERDGGGQRPQWGCGEALPRAFATRRGTGHEGGSGGLGGAGDGGRLTFVAALPTNTMPPSLLYLHYWYKNRGRYSRRRFV